MRQRLNLNRDWRFTRSDPPGADRVDFDDSAWHRVGLPHTFDLPYFRTPEFYVGHGWYRRTFDVPADWTRGRHLSLEFDGVFQVAEVFVNGHRVGYHRGGYTGFSVDITRAVRPGNNLLAVRANNRWDPQTAPRAGEHIFSGGIYRDVHLTVKDAVHVTHSGTWVTTPDPSHDSGTVRTRTALHNAHDHPVTCVVTNQVLDPAGNPVGPASASTEGLGPGESYEIDHLSAPITHPLLWHPDHPHLYTVRTTVLVHGQEVDHVDTPFGFRWFEWTADRGFFLNGEHLYLRGANAHQDRAGWGIAGTRAAQYRDVRLIKEAGFNFVRGAHYPHHPAFADACDRLGLIFLPENCFWGKGGFGPEGYWNASAFPANPDDWRPFGDHCKQTLRELIAQNRNHPSVVAWSMTNEAFFTYHVEDAKKLVRELVTLSHELDPTRPAAVGGAQRGDFDKLGDVACYNGDGARLFIDPGVPNMVSEYGAISKPPTAYEPFRGELQEEHYPWRAGEAIWCGFDYGSIAGKQGLKGILDHYRLPKRSWHWYRKHNLGIDPPELPVDNPASRLEVSADKTTLAACDGTDDCLLVATVHDASGRRVSASPPVTLTIATGPGEFPTGRAITFDPATDIHISDGQAGIEFRSYHAGRTVIRATSLGLEPAEIEIVTRGEPEYVEGVTPPVEDRPYVPPTLSEQAVKSLQSIVNVAKDRPSRAGSEAPAHPARLANDGANDSYWAPAPGSTEAWWRVDLEGFYQLASLRLIFPGTGNHRYVVETSRDAVAWELAVDRRATVRTDPVRNDVMPPGCVARYVRVTLTGETVAGLAEVELHGVLSVR